MSAASPVRQSIAPSLSRRAYRPLYAALPRVRRGHQAPWGELGFFHGARLRSTGTYPVRDLWKVPAEAGLGRATVQFAEDTAPVPAGQFLLSAVDLGVLAQRREDGSQRDQLAAVRQVPGVESCWPCRNLAAVRIPLTMAGAKRRYLAGVSLSMSSRLHPISRGAYVVRVLPVPICAVSGSLPEC
jgi:hypothetical protein